jgi:hypothetical protein
MYLTTREIEATINALLTQSAEYGLTQEGDSAFQKLIVELRSRP